MCTKFAEVILAVHFRERNEHGDLVGGPMYYIKNGLGKKWHWLAVAFSVFGILTVFGTGNATQVNTITAAVNSALLSYNMIPQSAVVVSNLIIGVVIMLAVVFQLHMVRLPEQNLRLQVLQQPMVTGYPFLQR